VEAEKHGKELLGKLDLSSEHGKQQKVSIDTYLRVMKNVVKDGAGFVSKEQQRIEKLIADKAVSRDKRTMFSKKLNIVFSFAPST
jgi:hypothetical protein